MTTRKKLAKRKPRAWWGWVWKKDNRLFARAPDGGLRVFTSEKEARSHMLLAYGGCAVRVEIREVMP